MKPGNAVELKAKKVLCTEMTNDKKVFQCKVLKYDAKKEYIYILLENEKLPDISLDTVYECMVSSGEGKICCDGRVKERYKNERGDVLEFQIENGFYKINIKSVDKQEA